MEDFNQRLDKLISAVGHNKNSFSREIGLDNNVVIGRLVRETSRKPSFEILSKILEAFPDVNPTWLILGKGEMMDKNNDDLPDFPDRVGRVMNYLKSSPLELANKIGTSITDMSNLLIKGSAIKEDKIFEMSEKIHQSYPEISIEWLTRNESPMILGDSALIDSLLRNAIPITANLNNIPKVQTIRDEFMLIKGIRDAFAVPMFGDNMKPDISPSDTILCRPIAVEGIMYGDTHLICTDGGHKRVGKIARKGDLIVINSTNPDFEPIEVQRSSVENAYHVIGAIKKFSI